MFPLSFFCARKTGDLHIVVRGLCTSSNGDPSIQILVKPINPCCKQKVSHRTETIQPIIHASLNCSSTTAESACLVQPPAPHTLPAENRGPSSCENQSPIAEVDGTSMFDRSASCTGQDRSVASQLRGSRQADGGSADGSDDNSGGDGALPPWSGRSIALYPDTRTCLIWQKLQMLNCCRAEGGRQVDLQPSPPPSQGGLSSGKISFWPRRSLSMCRNSSGVMQDKVSTLQMTCCGCRGVEASLIGAIEGVMRP